MNKELLDTFKKVIPIPEGNPDAKGMPTRTLSGYSFQEVVDILGFEPNYVKGNVVDFLKMMPNNISGDNFTIADLMALVNVTPHKAPILKENKNAWHFKFENEECLMVYQGVVIVSGCVYSWYGKREIFEKLFPEKPDLISQLKNKQIAP